MDGVPEFVGGVFRCVPLSEDAILLGKAVAANPRDDTVKMAFADELTACGADFAAALVRLDIYRSELVRDILAGFGLPAALADERRK